MNEEEVMVTTLSIKIQGLVVNSQATDSGNWQYVGATAVEQSSNEEIQLIAMKRDNNSCGSDFSASMVTATLIFATRQSEVSDHMAIQGLHDLKSNNEIGSVSAASPRFAAYIGGAFSFDAKEGVLTINSRVS